MVQRSKNSHQEKVDALPFFARMKRDEPFRSADQAEWTAAADHIAGPTGWYAVAGGRGHSGYKLIYFATPAEADEMQHWIDSSGIADRPMPKVGLSKEEIEADRRETMEWALTTGAGRQIVQAYRRSIHGGHGGHITAMCAAYKTAGELGCKPDGMNARVELIIDWARETFPDWFYRCRPEEPPAPPKRRAVLLPRLGTAAAAPAAPDPPRWRPTF